MTTKKNAQTPHRTIQASEVRNWFGKFHKAELSDAQYREIATRLTRFRWKKDPPDDSNSPWLQKLVSSDDKEWWDFKATLDAAGLLIKSTPKMLDHWDALQHWPETRDGYKTIEKLHDALIEAMPYIARPFGEGDRRTGAKTPKIWHVPSLSIARLVINMMAAASQKSPAISKNTIVVRVVRSALIRMEFPAVEPTTIAAYLTRYDRKFGLTPKGILRLTTKHAPLAL